MAMSRTQQADAEREIRRQLADGNYLLREAGQRLPLVETAELAIQLRAHRQALIQLNNRYPPQTIRDSNQGQRLSAMIARMAEVAQQLEDRVSPQYMGLPPDQMPDRSDIYSTHGPPAHLRPHNRQVLTREIAKLKARLKEAIQAFEAQIGQVDQFLNTDENQYFQDPTRLAELATRLDSVGTRRTGLTSALAVVQRAIDDLNLLVRQSGAAAVYQIGELDWAQQAAKTIAKYLANQNKKLQLLEAKVRRLRQVQEWVPIGTARDQQIRDQYNQIMQRFTDLEARMGPMVDNIMRVWLPMDLTGLMDAAPQTQAGVEPPLIRQMEQTPGQLLPLCAQLEFTLNQLERNILLGVPRFVLERLGLYKDVVDFIKIFDDFLYSAQRAGPGLQRWMARHFPLYRQHWQEKWAQHPQGQPQPHPELDDHDLYD